MSKGRVLHLICPPQRRAQPVISCCFAAIIAMVGIFRNIQPILAGEMYGALMVALLVLGVATAILYKNLFFQDQIYILGTDTSAPGLLPSINAADIISVRRRHASDVLSVESRMRWLFLFYGTIEIETVTHKLYFGVGLDDFSAESKIREIEEFCNAERGQGAMSERLP